MAGRDEPPTQFGDPSSEEHPPQDQAACVGSGVSVMEFVTAAIEETLAEKSVVNQRSERSSAMRKPTGTVNQAHRVPVRPAGM